jgi:hypothetical protein
MNKRKTIVWVHETLHVGWLKAIWIVLVIGLRVGE